jgi:hypothetical protein
MSRPFRAGYPSANYAKFEKTFNVTVAGGDVGKFKTIASGAPYSTIFDGTNKIWVYDIVVTTTTFLTNPTDIKVDFYRTAKADAASPIAADEIADKCASFALLANMVDPDRIEESVFRKEQLKIVADTAETYIVRVRCMYEVV